MADNFIFYGNTYESLSKIPDEAARNDLAWRILKYGCTGEVELTDDPYKNGWLEQLIPAIKRAKEDYQKRKDSGANSGRKPSFSREELMRLIAEGRSAIEIAALLNVTKDAIYHDVVWKERKANNMYRT